MFRCIDCGAEFDEPARWEEYRGECFGSPAYEEWSGCPCCHGDYEEITEDEDEESEKETDEQN